MEQGFLTIIKEVFNINKGKGLELLLVTEGVKRGDLLDWTLLKKRKKILLNINDLMSIGAPITYFKVSDLIDKSTDLTINYLRKNIFFYNTSRATEPEIQDFKQAIIEQRAGKKEMGWFYEYPECCIQAYPFCIYYLPEFTEWRWCRVDCKASLLKQEQYKKVIQEHFKIDTFQF